MSLSDRDRELLNQMEASLAKEDPKLQSMLEGYSTAKNAKKILSGFTLVFVGISIILAGVISKVPVIGLVGFLVALFGVILSQSVFQIFSNGFIAGTDMNIHANRKTRKTFAQKMEERWARRNLDN